MAEQNYTIDEKRCVSVSSFEGKYQGVKRLNYQILNLCTTTNTIKQTNVPILWSTMNITKENISITSKNDISGENIFQLIDNLELLTENNYFVIFMTRSKSRIEGYYFNSKQYLIFLKKSPADIITEYKYEPIDFSFKNTIDKFCELNRNSRVFFNLDKLNLPTCKTIEEYQKTYYDTAKLFRLFNHEIDDDNFYDKFIHVYVFELCKELTKIDNNVSIIHIDNKFCSRGNLKCDGIYVKNKELKLITELCLPEYGYSKYDDIIKKTANCLEVALQLKF